MSRPEIWLWPISVLSAALLHVGAALLVGGGAPQAGVKAPEPLRVTLSAGAAVLNVAAPSVVPTATARPALPLPTATADVRVPPAVAQTPAASPVVAPAGKALQTAAAVPPQSATERPEIPTAAAVPVAAASDVLVAAATIAPTPAIASAIQSGLSATSSMGSGIASSIPPTQAVSTLSAVAAGSPAVAPSSVGPIAASPPTGAPVTATQLPLVAGSSPPTAALPPNTLAVVAAPVATAGDAAPASVPSPTSPLTVSSTVAQGAAAVPVVPTTILASLPDPATALPTIPDDLPSANSLDLFVSQYDGGECFAANVMPGDAPVLAAFALDLVDSMALQLALGEAFGSKVTVDSYQVDSRQCGALAFVDALRRNRAFNLTVVLDSQLVADGANLTGTLDVPSGHYVSLFIVDDEGAVSQVGAYVSGIGQTKSFSIPVHLKGEAATRIQLLVAVASQAPPPSNIAGVATFEILADELKGATTGVAIHAFALR